MNFLTSHSNSLCQVLDVIRSQEKIHWYWALRQAELHTEDKRSILAFAEQQLRKSVARKQFVEEKNAAYQKAHDLLRAVPIVGSWVNMRLTETKIELEGFNDPNSINRLNSQIRDCRMEMEVAQSEYERILSEHPEIRDYTYEQLQEISIIALQEKKANLIAISHLSLIHGLPESATSILSEIGQEEMTSILGSEIKRVVDVSQSLPQLNAGEK